MPGGSSMTDANVNVDKIEGVLAPARQKHGRTAIAAALEIVAASRACWRL